MCLAHPAQVLSLEDGTAVVAVRGHRRRAILLALDGGPPAAGDWLLVQSGIAVARLDPAEAARRDRLFDDIEGATP